MSVIGCELWNWAGVPECLVVFRCLYHESRVRIVGWFYSCCWFRHATLFLASWACACRASCGLAHLIPSEDSCVGVPTDPWSVPLFWHPNFRLTVLTPRCPRCAFHTLDETVFQIPDRSSLEPNLLCFHRVLLRQCARRSLWLFQAKCLE